MQKTDNKIEQAEKWTQLEKISDISPTNVLKGIKTARVLTYFDKVENADKGFITNPRTGLRHKKTTKQAICKELGISQSTIDRTMKDLNAPSPYGYEKKQSNYKTKKQKETAKTTSNKPSTSKGKGKKKTLAVDLNTGAGGGDDYEGDDQVETTTTLDSMSDEQLLEILEQRKLKNKVKGMRAIPVGNASASGTKISPSLQQRLAKAQEQVSDEDVDRYTKQLAS
jgi:hypothetical protein